MERLARAVLGVEQALRMAPAGAGLGSQHEPALAGALAGAAPPADRFPEPPAWLHAVRERLPLLVEALVSEPTEVVDSSSVCRAHRLATERVRLLQRVHHLLPALTRLSGSSRAGDELEGLRRELLRLVTDITHHQQRVHDLVYEDGWRDHGGSE